MAQRITFGEQQRNQIYTPRIGVYAVILRFQRDQVATIKNERGSYFLPGGGIQPGEDHDACLRRELIEETGYQIRMGTYIGEAEQYHMSLQGNPTLGIGHFYLAEMLKKVHDPDESGELTWLGIRQASELLCLQNQAWAVTRALNMF